MILKGDNLSVGDKVKVMRDIPSVNGMLYKGSVVKVDEIKDRNNPVRGNVRLVDNLGKIWWVNKEDIVNV